MEMKRLPVYLLAYAMWVVAMLLGMLFMLLGVNGIPQLLALQTGVGELGIRMQAIFYQRMFLIFAGIGILIIIVAVENYFRHGAQSNTLWQRIARVFGPELLLIFFADLAQVALMQLPFGLNRRWLILGLELIAAIVLIYLGYRKPLPRMPHSPTSTF